jgi:hypothetical protein
MRYLLLMALYIALVAYCITDVLNHPDEEPYGLHRLLWIALIVLIPYIGAAAWLLMKFRRRGQARPRTVAPDDDPDYLRWLREQQRRRGSDGR